MGNYQTNPIRVTRHSTSNSYHYLAVVIARGYYLLPVGVAGVSSRAGWGFLLIYLLWLRGCLSVAGVIDPRVQTRVEDGVHCSKRLRNYILHRCFICNLIDGPED